VLPTGEQIEIESGDQRAVVVEVGGGLRTYEAAGQAVLDGYEPSDMCRSGRGQVLIPWPNRLQDGSYEFGGRRHQLPLNEIEKSDAIHGLVRWSAWTAGTVERDRAVMEHVLHPQPGYPFSLALHVEYALGPDGLSVTTTATNAGTEPCPYGSGAHPYLTLGSAGVDVLVLCVPAAVVLSGDEHGIPVGRFPVDGTDYDFREPKPIGSTRLDDCFTDLERDGDDLVHVRLEHPDGGGRTLWADDAYGYLMVFTGDPLPDVHRRSLAVEPMTCPPNAFRSGEALITLAPGASFSSTWGITPG